MKNKVIQSLLKFFELFFEVSILIVIGFMLGIMYKSYGINIPNVPSESVLFHQDKSVDDIYRGILMLIIFITAFSRTIPTMFEKFDEYKKELQS